MNPPKQARPPLELLRRIGDLRERFLAAKDLSDPFDYFDERVASCSLLFDHSDSSSHEVLLGIIAAGIRVVRPEFELRQHWMFQVRGTDLWHGLGHGQRGQVFFFYFANLGMGLVGLEAPPTPQTPRRVMHFLRISMLPAATTGSFMPGPVTRGVA